MHISWYGDHYYGSTHYGEVWALDVELTLNYHITSTDNQYAFYWEISEPSITPGITAYDWELQISDTPYFSNYYVYDKSTALVYHDGYPTQGYEIEVFPRKPKEWQRIYARVRAIYGEDYSPFSPVISVDLFPDFVEETAEHLLMNLYGNAYNKDLLIMDPQQRDTNLFNILRMYGTEIDKAKLEIERIKVDKSISKCRDEVLYDNFGVLFDFVKPNQMDVLQYRQLLRKLMESTLVQGTNKSIINVVTPFTGVSPDIIEARREINLICVDVPEDPRVSNLDDLGIPPNTITRNTAAHGVSIYVNNPANFPIDYITLNNLLDTVIPSHIYYNIKQGL